MYRCRVEGDPHEGPCAAPELGRTMIERQRWETEQRSATAAAEAASVSVVQSPGEVVESDPGDTASVSPRSYADAVTAAAAILHKPQADLPPAIKAWLTGAAAQITLNGLWSAADEAFGAGATSVTFTKAQLEALVPEHLRFRP